MLKPIFKTTREIDHVKTGERAKLYRRARYISGQQVADLMGLDQSAISLLESGKRRWSEDEFSRYVAAVDTINSEPTEN